jgi:hypothetical protein
VYNPDLSAFVANVPHIPRPLCAKVLRITNKASKNLLAADVENTEEEEAMARGIVAFLEVYAKSITNVWSGHYVDHRVMTPAMLPNQRTNPPRVSVVERNGRVFQNLLYAWFNKGYSADVLFYEPDATNTTAVLAWRFTKMRPNSTGGDEVVLNLSEAGKPIEFTVGLNFFECAHDESARLEADEVLKQFGKQFGAINANPDLAPVFDKDSRADRR